MVLSLALRRPESKGWARLCEPDCGVFEGLLESLPRPLSIGLALSSSRPCDGTRRDTCVSKRGRAAAPRRKHACLLQGWIRLSSSRDAVRHNLSRDDGGTVSAPPPRVSSRLVVAKPAVQCPRSDSNRLLSDFKSLASADWATRANRHKFISTALWGNVLQLPLAVADDFRSHEYQEHGECNANADSDLPAGGEVVSADLRNIRVGNVSH